MTKDDPSFRGAKTLGPSEPSEGQPGTSGTPRGPTADIAPGTTVGRYILLDLLGKGGMGVGYKAYDPELDRIIALKFVTVSSSTQKKQARRRIRLLREAQALARLSHPNVVAIYDVGVFGDDVFIAMELVQGQTLLEWISSTSPPIHTTLAMVIEAGRGLAAAHQANLIHRDFKPANVVIGEDGRVRVLDFGLARTAGKPRGQDDLLSADSVDTKDVSLDSPETPPPERPREDLAALSSSGKWLNTPLTQLGAVVGTPAYMAPEQILGTDIDPRTDQYSFCLVLYEALYRIRPFATSEDRDEVFEKMRGRLPPSPAGSAVPTWVRKIIERGLSSEPDERYPDLDALLAELGADPGEATRKRSASRRQTALIAIAVLSLLLAIGAFTANLHRQSTLCQGVEHHLQGVWDEHTRERAKKGLLSTGKPYAVDAWKAVERVLGEYSRAWVSMHQEACAATRIRGEQSEAILDLRMACLQQRLSELKLLGEVFSRGEEGVAEKAAQAAYELIPITHCANLEALKSRVMPPRDEQQRAEIEQVQKTLSESSVLSKTGKFKDALALAVFALQKAKSAGHALSAAQALYQSGLMKEYLGEYESAEQEMTEAYLQVLAGGDDRLAAQYTIRLLFVIGYERARPKDARIFSRQAQAMIVRLGQDKELLGEWHANLASVLTVEGDVAGAIEHDTRALELRQKILPAEHPKIAQSHLNLGDSYSIEGDLQKAGEHMTQALELMKKNLGPAHPFTAFALNNLGNLYYQWEDQAKSLEYHRQALAIWERALGRDHPNIAMSLRSQANVLVDLGELSKAEELFARAKVIWERTSGPEHPDVALVLNDLGSIYLKRHQLDQADAVIQQALRIREKALGKDHVSVANTLVRLADLEEQRRHPQKAELLYRRALAIQEKTLGPEHADLAPTLIKIAEVDLRRGQLSSALPTLERALAICALKNRHCSKEANARARHLLGNALLQHTSNKERAQQLLREAQQILASDPRLKDRLEEDESWIQQTKTAP